MFLVTLMSDLKTSEVFKCELDITYTLYYVNLAHIENDMVTSLGAVTQCLLIIQDFSVFLVLDVHYLIKDSASLTVPGSRRLNLKQVNTDQHMFWGHFFFLSIGKLPKHSQINKQASKLSTVYLLAFCLSQSLYVTRTELYVQHVCMCLCYWSRVLMTTPRLPLTMTVSIIRSLMKTANRAVQNKSFVPNPTGLLHNLANDTSCIKQALIFLGTYVCYCNSEQIQSILPCCCVNWWPFNIHISHLPHSFKHASVKETDTQKNTQSHTSRQTHMFSWDFIKSNFCWMVCLIVTTAQPWKYIENCKQDRGQKVATGGRK